MDKTLNKKTPIRYEMYIYSGSVGGTTHSLVLNDPAEVTFECFGGSLLGTATINNVYTLQPMIDYTNGLSTVEYKKTFKTNTNEFDQTKYVLNVSSPNIFVVVTCKYYINKL